MDIEIKRDKLDGSDWMHVCFTASENELDHDAITELQLIRHKHNLNGGDSANSSYVGPAVQRNLADHQTLYIENPTPEFEKDLMFWLLKT